MRKQMQKTNFVLRVLAVLVLVLLFSGTPTVLAQSQSVDNMSDADNEASYVKDFP